MNKQLLVSALENGTVIDHIPCERTNDVLTLLKLNSVSSTVMIGINLESKKMGRKTIIKVADKFFSDDELNKLSVIAPDVTLCIIRNYEVVEKKEVRMPEELRDIVRCANPKCITNNEPMHTVFHVINKQRGIMKCHYCEKEQQIKDAKLK
ncbi:MAG: aspartate carbamoyltransferase regulatory subunit [Bacteroidaceae bacterium]|nr:aspartate carbamoyltransferase regulatory subunit [Bacteroidaceae bacterium]MBR3372752.1 aspartate carbamoyltransferase regulatory subunit [Bacteroidaceae bacterium]MBR4649462.1 aspartate carbamoyltransferase regulatory subunit [Bacteroidaceae bacterium]MBR6714800.1 aspartate carbamoyltransferase regulatory subunit [Bacteroidaceae bacterium]